MKIVLAEAYSNMAEAITTFPFRMRQGEGEVVYDGRNRVVKFLCDGHHLMVKRYKRVNLIQQVVYTFFRKTKAERAFLFAREFEKRGIDTPESVAYMEERCMGLFSVGYFVSREVPGTETSLLLREVKDYAPNLAEAVARQVVLMHSKGVLHGDLNLSNFLCTQQQDSYHFSMIDINRSKFCEGWPSDEACLKNLVRITHRRDLYVDIISRYATLRGWDVSDTVRKAVALLDRFEQKRFRF